MSEMTREKFRGCLLGLAVGDAMGTTLEFTRPGTFETIDDMIGGGPFGLEPGQWTDDTSMALCLAGSLLEFWDHNPQDQMERYVFWYQKGFHSSTGECFDIGNTVKAALHRFMETGDPIAGLTDEHSAGNGSLMRLAPVPLFFAADPEVATEMAGKSSLTTHGNRQAVDACRYFAGLIVGALGGESKDKLLSDRYHPTGDYWKGRHELHPNIDEVARDSFKHREPPEIVGSGYVVRTLEAVLWAFHRSSTFEEGLIKVVNLGDDADTTGAVYGQLAGAYYGEEEIPARWREKIAMSDTLIDYANLLFYVAEGNMK